MKQFNFTLEQVQRLFTMQDELNTYIHPEWKSQGFNWNDAIVDECQEILGHLGWKWWKKDYQCGITKANKQQLKLEVIDILHFVVSDVERGVFPEKATYFLERLNRPYDQSFGDGSAELEWLTRAMRQGEDCCIAQLAAMAHCLDMTEAEILGTYAQKYVLNKFRQDNGYKDGTYEKHWEHAWAPDGFPRDVLPTKVREDNEVLAELVQDMQEADLDTTDPKALYSGLELAYNCRLNKPAPIN